LNIVQATRAYEAWAGKRIHLIDADLDLKHEKMGEAPLPFLRATYYRWAIVWRELCPELADGPVLLSVGDLHIENFGTWRDAEGRLVWGVNDFDEAFPMAYSADLVRLATSALLAIKTNELSVSADEACNAILAGYSEAAQAGQGRAFVLEESHSALRAMAMGSERDPARFWAKLSSLKHATPPGNVQKMLRNSLPGEPEWLKPKERVRFAHRIAGLGSLGRERYVAMCEWRGGFIAREAKAMLPSAYAWATGSREKRKYFYNKILENATRAADPFLQTSKGWAIRRLSPHCSRINLGEFPKKRDEMRILKAMGEETANVHFGPQSAVADIRQDLCRLRDGWLTEAANKMAEAINKDWKTWRKA
jgi:uncharacterized protein (DUF2252 family)